MRALLYIIATAFVLLAAACVRHSESWAALDCADAVMEERPDSALALLRDIDTYTLNGDEENARYALLVSMALMKEGYAVIDTSFIASTLTYYQDDDSPEYMKSLYLTAESLMSFIDVATDLSGWVKNPKLDIGRLSVDLHQVCQDYAESCTVDINALECEVRNAFVASDIPLSIIRKAQRYRCYAERNNSILVNYNGDLFRCTACDFTRENREGVLTDNGTLVWNDRSKNRNAIKWSNPTCCLCEIYPLSGGACSQNKLESKRISGCDYGYAQKDKDDIITARIDWLLAKAQNNNINH